MAIYENEAPASLVGGYNKGDPMRLTWEGSLEEAGLDGSRKEDALGKRIPEFLEEIFRCFNSDDRPNGSNGMALSIGGVIVISSEKVEDMYFAVERVGFREIAPLKGEKSW